MRSMDIVPGKARDIVSGLLWLIVSQGLGEYLLLILRKTISSLLRRLDDIRLRRTISCLRQDDILPLVGP